jgi:hypothetical protein
VPLKLASSALIRLRVDPMDAGAATSLLTATVAEDNVVVSKFISMFSHSCIDLTAAAPLGA